jgi:isocitrate dehydrogenase
MAYRMISIPEQGEKITFSGGKLNVPDHPILIYIEGDGTGSDIWAASRRVIDAAVRLAYGEVRKIEWMAVPAGEKAFVNYGTWLPDETLQAFKEFMVGIKGPLTNPLGRGERPLNVTLRKELDLSCACRCVTLQGFPPPSSTPSI